MALNVGDVLQAHVSSMTSMPVNPLRRKLAAGQTVIGPLLQEIPSSPELVEFLVATGFDGCFLGAGDMAFEQ